MNNKEPNLNLPLECYHNGAFDLLSPQEAKKALEEADLYWLCPKDEYGWNTSGHKGAERNVCSRAGKRSLQLAFLIHASTEPYTMLQAQKDINGGKLIEDPNLFATWVSRFNRIFRKGKTLLLPREFWPMRYVDLPIGTRGITCPAYKLNPEVDIFVLAGVDCDSDFTSADIPWDYLTSKE